MGKQAKRGADERRPAWFIAFSVRRVGAVYVWAVLVVFFGLLEPDRFLTSDTLLIIVNGYAISGIVAVGLVVPLAAGMFDVSVGYAVALCGTVVAYLVSNEVATPLQAVGLTLLIAVVAGLVNGFAIVGLRIMSLIATLATGAIFLSATTGISDQQSITANVGGISDLFSAQVGELTMSVLLLGVLTLVVWFVMRFTVVGRYWYAIGFDSETARLAGLPVRLLQTIALVISAVCAGLAGILLTARIGAGVPTSGPAYLLPAFAAAFVGGTQFSPGRFNALGTFVAVYLLATATVGLNLVGAPIWAPKLLSGVILIVAVASNSMTGGGKRRGVMLRMAGRHSLRWKRGFRRRSSVSDWDLRMPDD